MTFLSLFGFPVDTSVSGPVEISNFLNSAGCGGSLDTREELLLVHMDRDKGLNFGSLEHVGQITTTKLGQVVHNCLNFFSFSSKGLVTVLLTLEALSDLLGPNELDSEQSDLGLVLGNEGKEGL